MNALLALAEAPARQIVWVLRNDVAVAAPGRRDALPHRAALEERAADLVARGRVERIDGFTTAVVRGEREGAVLIDRGGRQLPAVDEIVVATGQRPDRAMHGALPLDLDADLQCPTALAPLIDPRRHSCRTALAHGAQQLAHARLPGFYVAGIKSYGRAPTFLMATGYGQVVSIADALALGLPARRAVGA
jgi:hypothetical protein